MKIFFIIVLFFVSTNCIATYEIPNSSSKFNPVISESKIQWQDGSLKSKVSKAAFNVANEYFYLSKENYLTFEMNKKEGEGKLRSELRQRDEWKTSDDIWNGLEGSIYINEPVGIDKLTWVQIHDSTRLNKPLLRLVWLKNYRKKKNHLWAILRTNTRLNGKYKKYDLGEKPDSFFNFFVRVKGNKLEALINDAYIEHDVSYWGNLSSYYKSGLYLNSKDDYGSAKVEFKHLKYFHSNIIQKKQKISNLENTEATTNDINELFTELKYGNLDNSNRENDAVVTPVIGWKGNHWRWQLLQDISLRDSKSRERYELETSYAYEGNVSNDFSFINGFRVFNEIEYRQESKEWKGQITPTWYKKITKEYNGFDTQIGVELEVDYLKRNNFGLYKVDLEPTIRTSREIGLGEFKAELELPKIRLYDKNRENFKVEGVEISASYRIALDQKKNTHLKFTVELPYDSEKNELRKKFFVSIRHKFK